MAERVDLEIRHLRLVAAIAETGSVTAASGRLHLTQSALSHQLRDVEERLGARLFLRLGRRMALTPAGTTLLASARDILDRLKATEDEIRRASADGAGVLRIAVECYTCYHWLPSLMKPFHARHPRVELRIAAEETRRPIEALLEGGLDLAIVSTRVPHRRLQYRPLFEDELLVITAPGHPLAARPFVRPADLRDERLLIYTTPEDSGTYQRILLPAGVAPRTTQVMLTEAMLELVRTGHGVAIMARWAVRPLVEAGAIAARPLTRRGTRRRWHAARLRGAAPDYLIAFEELLMKDPPARREAPALKARAG